MIVEVRGPYLGNAGDVMMLRAIVERLRAKHVLAVPPSLCTDDERQALGLRKTISLTGIASIDRHIIPDVSHLSVSRSSVGAILDCSGYAYGAAWGHERIEPLRKEMHKWKRRGLRVIFLPQAFGPFPETETRESMREILLQADRVYARDPISHRHLQDLGIPETILSLAPDFTAGVKLLPLKDYGLAPGTVAIIPNQRMMDQTSFAIAQEYPEYLLLCINLLRERGFTPLIVVHERSDIVLAEYLHERAQIAEPIVNHEDPRVLKAILGCCHAVIASRFHAQIAALSQAVPVLGTAWTHKYPALFKEYDCPSCLLSFPIDREHLAKKIDLVTREPQRSILVQQLSNAGLRQRQRIEWMWEEINGILV